MGRVTAMSEPRESESSASKVKGDDSAKGASRAGAPAQAKLEENSATRALLDFAFEEVARIPRPNGSSLACS
jgi:hypothetical protein